MPGRDDIKTVSFVSLGCPKNLVDSEKMLGLLAQDGLVPVSADTAGEGVPGFIRKAELSRDRSEQRPDRFAEGEKVDAKITQIDAGNRKLTLSVKALEVQEEKQAMADYGSSDSGASLGDILGAALEKKKEGGDE